MERDFLEKLKCMLKLQETNCLLIRGMFLESKNSKESEDFWELYVSGLSFWGDIKLLIDLKDSKEVSDDVQE